MNAIFIHIPKTAGTSIQEALGLGLPVGNGPLQDFVNEGRVSFNHLSVRQLVDEGCVSEDFLASSFKFTIVRNPFDRILSLYLYRQKFDKIVGPMSFLDYLRHLKDNTIPSIKPAAISSLSQKELLLEIRKINYAQGQANPQSVWLDVPVDFIGRFENLKDDFQQIAGKVVGEARLPLKNYTEKEKPWQEHYNAEARDIVCKLYEGDFETFNYSQEVA